MKRLKKMELQNFGGKIPANLKLPLRDGDIERPDDEAYADSYFIKLQFKRTASDVDRKVKRF